MKRDVGPLLIALLYVAFGTAWILLTDSLTLRLAGPNDPHPLAQTWKGLLYVGLTAALVYGLALYSTRRLRQERRRYSEMADHLGDLFYNYDPTNDRLLYANHFFEKIWGLTVREAKNEPGFYARRIHPDDHTVAASADRMKREGQPTETEYRLVGAGGAVTWVLDRSVSIRGRHGRVERIVGTVRDITEIKQAQQALADSRRQLTTLIDNLPGATYRCRLDPHWTTLFMSEGIIPLTGHAPADFRDGRVTYAQLIHPGDRERVYRIAVEAARHQEVFEIEYRIMHRDGTEKIVWERARVFPEENENGGFLEGFILDITDRKRAENDRQRLEERVQQSEKLEAIGQLAGGIAHDFNNLLTVILVRAEMALRKLQVGDALYGGVREIQDAAERSAGLARQLLTYSQRQPVKVRSLMLPPFIEATLPMLRRLVGGDVRLACAVPSNLWPVAIMPTQIDQILVNLCLNARDAMSTGGKLRIEIQNVTMDDEDCRRHPQLRPGGHVVIAVADTGCGMDRHTLGRLFEPFFTTKEIGKGTGLGLSIVHGIVRQLRGAIEVNSEPGKGSVFRIFLPRARAVEAHDEMIS